MGNNARPVEYLKPGGATLIALGLLISATYAGDVFPFEGGLDPDRPEIIDRAWAAFGKCTGAEPPNFESISFDWTDELGVYAGATVAEGNRAHVWVRPGEWQVFVTLHELAHHWVGWQPRALREGLSSLLAQCAYRQLSGDTTYHHQPVESFLNIKPLVSWDSDEGLTPEEISYNYYAAEVLAQRLAPLLTPEQRWNPRFDGSWADLWEMVGGSHALPTMKLAPNQNPAPDETKFNLVFESTDPEIGALLPVLTFDTTLGDVDGDGMPGIAEMLFGSEPFVWDSDGDGWWDGARPPKGAVAMPIDGACVGIPAADGALQWQVDTPDGATYAQPPISLSAGVPVILGGSSVRRREWITFEPVALAPCSPSPKVAGLWRLADIDADHDTLIDSVELARGTDPARFDSDGDGWWDGAMPPAGVIPLTEESWACMGTNKGDHEFRVREGGPDASAVHAYVTHDQRTGLVGLSAVGPKASRAWAEILGPPRRACPALVPARPGRICLGEARSAGPVTLTIDGAPEGEVAIVARLVDGRFRAEDAPVLVGERIEVLVRFSPGFRGIAQIRTDQRLDPCWGALD